MLGVLLLAPDQALADPDHGEIIVTARREAERASDVPLSISVVSADSIAAGSTENLQTLAQHVPGLTFEAIFGGSNSFPIMRGQNQPSVAGDSVGMFVDGVYQASRDAIDVEPLDLERIEVVHGPQSALFGHSSFAGLISYVPAQPTETLLLSAAADGGTDNLRGIRGTVSGPLSSVFKARLAASWKAADGTYENAAAPGQSLGTRESFAIAATVATRDGSGPLSARLSARYGDSRSSQPPFNTLDYRDYNCGGRDATSGAWSYFCGAAPVRTRYSLSPDVPDSHTRTGQVALHLALDLGEIELRSDTSYFDAAPVSYRDFDGSAGGDLYGVCIQGVNCTGIGSLSIPVVRVQRVNIVNKRTLGAREVGQELRIASTGERRLNWQLGATIFWTRTHMIQAFGGERGALAANEQLSSLVLSNPQRVGSPAAINNALFADPNADQSIQNDNEQDRRTIALFATTDYRLTETLRLRGELRVTWERQLADSRRANFAPSFGTSLGARHFHDVTPRISVDWRPADGWMLFASYARGSRSGGINLFPDLLPEEQTFAPETNWTREIGVKYAGSGLIRSAMLAGYDIDWRDTQILGLSTTPGVTALITRNTTGVHTQGLEAAAIFAPARWLQADFAYAWTDPRFKAGSEDPGSNGYCGLTVASVVSTLCTVRLSTISQGQLVPDISGKRLLRAAPTVWNAGLTLMPQTPLLHGARLRIGLSHQSDVFERNINGLSYGARTLADARLTIPLGEWSLDLWGTNLGGARYIRAAVGRQPNFYTGIPRPTDLILGEARRIGLSLRFER